MSDLAARIDYSDKYRDPVYEYRHVTIPKELLRSIPDRLMSESEWRAVGVQQSRGWVHYAIHKPEPHVLLFRRLHGTDPVTGRVDKEEAARVRREVFEELGLEDGEETKD